MLSVISAHSYWRRWLRSRSPFHRGLTPPVPAMLNVKFGASPSSPSVLILPTEAQRELIGMSSTAVPPRIVAV